MTCSSDDKSLFDKIASMNLDRLKVPLNYHTTKKPPINWCLKHLQIPFKFVLDSAPHKQIVASSISAVVHIRRIAVLNPIHQGAVPFRLEIVQLNQDVFWSTAHGNTNQVWSNWNSSHVCYERTSLSKHNNFSFHSLNHNGVPISL